MRALTLPRVPNASPDARLLTVNNVLTGEPLGSVPVMSAVDVAAAVSRARAAQPAWEAAGVKARTRIMRAWVDLLVAHQDRMMDLIRAETGKSKGGAWGEIAVLDNVVNYYRRTAPGLLRPSRRQVTFPIFQRAQVVYKPYPVVGFLTPWNYPLQNGFIDITAALFAGCAIIIKPSEVTPFTALLAAELLHQAGVPEACAQVMTGDGSTGAALTDSVDYISLTGSTATGRKVAMRAAERLIPYSLELGGKGAGIVLEDADLNIAASWSLTGALENAGQACVAIERVYVLESIHDAYVEKVRQWADKLVVSAADDYAVDVGSMTNARELERTEAHIADAVAKGARVLTGGKRRPDLGPRFLEPTVLVDVTDDMQIMREETFGPVMPIMKVRDLDEAIRRANNSDYGLSNTLFAGDLNRAMQLARRLDSGDVMINRPAFAFGTPDLPMGGVKFSGIGRRNGPEGLRRFLKPQAILADNMRAVGPSLTQTSARTRSLFALLRKIRPFFPYI
ncbi:MAG: aldehyde dehydrogenase family protein [Pleurocapsa minor GSE-CHR-MK-17-07R]|jgi:succinate-semialdehyde dehydrogenase/glutarate-semialdehyde dehydrogenase|nr:aldehyde dehydrogenase family protein [Pleurocapsa minor GSE-CHR-MK 17-07R]